MSYLILLIGVAGVGLGLLRPYWGLLYLALLTPFLDVIRYGPVDAGQLIGVSIIVGAGWRLSQRPHLLRSQDYAVAGLVLLLIGYGTIAGNFSAPQLTLATLGTLGLSVSALALARDQTGESPETAAARWFITLGASVAVVNLAMFAIVIFVPPLRQLVLKFTSEGIRMLGPYDNPNSFGGLQLFVVAMMAYAIVASRTLVQRALASGALALAFAAVIASQSRSAIGGMFLAIGLVAAAQVAFSSRPFRNGLLLATAGIAMIFLFLNLPQQLFGLDLARVETGQVYELDVESATSRLWLIESGLTALAARPEGLGYVQALNVSIGEISGTYKTPHNFVVVALLLYGVVGGALMIGVYLLPLLYAARLLLLRRIDARSPGVFAAAGLAGFYLHNTFHSNMQWATVWVFWAFTMAALLHTVRLRRRSAAPRRHRSPHAPLARV